jgi:hypothetical protein
MSAKLTWSSRLAVAIVFSLTAWHIAHNATPPAWDDAWYLEMSFRLWKALNSSILYFISAYRSAFQIKAPLIALVPLPLYAFYSLFNIIPTEKTAVWMNLPLGLVTVWAWQKTARLWWRGQPRAEEAAILGGALTALLPLSYGLSRIFFAENLVVALLALTAWRCAAAHTESRRDSITVGMFIGLGLLAKVTFPLLAAGFIWPARKRLWPHAKAIALTVTLIAATWYADNIATVLGFAYSAGFGKIAKDYSGSGGAGGASGSMITLEARDP